jgi:LemA protein
MRRGGLLGCVGLLVLVVVIGVIVGIGSRNKFVTLGTAVDAQWAQVENVYQRRYDLIPNLVRTVQGAANFEKSTLEAVVKARASVGQVAAPAGGFNPNATSNVTNDPETFKKYEEAQANLGSALSRLLVVVERYPELKANQNFLDLQAELAGTENRIAVERKRYNDKAQDYNTSINLFPGNLFASMFGFKPKAFFKGVAGSDKPPEVNFDFSNTAPATATR